VRGYNKSRQQQADDTILIQAYNSTSTFLKNIEVELNFVHDWFVNLFLYQSPKFTVPTLKLILEEMSYRLPIGCHKLSSFDILSSKFGEILVWYVTLLNDWKQVNFWLQFLAFNSVFITSLILL